MRPVARLLLLIPVFATPAFAQFNPGPNPITTIQTAQRTLTSGTGTIDLGGGIVISTGNPVPLLMSGTSTLINNGTIQTLGSGRAIDSTVAGANLTVTNNGLISAVSTDGFRVNTNSAVSLTNSGTIQVTGGGQAIDWANITSAANTLTNNSTGRITAVGEDAVRPGVFGQVINAGFIGATPVVTAGDASGSDGIDLRTQTHVTVTNSGTITGRHGIATDGANVGPSTLFVTNNSGGLISAINGSGINVDGVNTSVEANVTNAFGATIRGGVLGNTTTGDGDGIDVDGVLTLNNSGNVFGLGARGADNNAEGVAAGGGHITNYASGVISGSSLLADAPNSDPTHGGNGILIDDSNGGNAVAATTIDNFGVIQGKAGFGVKIVGTFSDRINNNAGASITGTSNGAALQTGGGNDRVDNAGVIVGSGGMAVDLGDGDDQLNIVGGQASIVGDVSGGTGSNTALVTGAAGDKFVYAGVLSNFSSVEVAGGDVTLSGANQYTGTTRISGGSLTLDGRNRLSTASLLELGAGSLHLINAGGADGQHFAGLLLDAAHAVLDLGLSSITFDSLVAIADGASLGIVNWSKADSPDYAIRFLGDATGSAAFLALIGQATVNGVAAAYSFDGTYTNVVSAVPLPGALLLMGSGVGLLGAFRRRKGIHARGAAAGM